MAMLELFNFLHFVGLAYGVGGATIAALVSKKAEKDPETNQFAMKILLSISKLIWFGLILLVISGIGIYLYIRWPINKEVLLIKHILVAWIFIIGIVIGISIRKIKTLMPKPKEKPSLQFLKIKKQLKILSAINLILWYIVVLLSVFV